MKTDNFVERNVADSELEEFSESEQAIFSTICLQQCIQQELQIPTLHQVQLSLIAIESTLRHISNTAEPKKFGIFTNPTLYKHNIILKAERE